MTPPFFCDKRSLRTIRRLSAQLLACISPDTEPCCPACLPHLGRLSFNDKPLEWCEAAMARSLMSGDMNAV